MLIASFLTSKQKHMVLKTMLSSEGSEEPAHLHSLVSTFALEVEEDSGEILDFKLNLMHKNRPLKRGFAHTLTLYVILTGLPWSGKKFWKMKNFPGQGKVRELHFQSGKFKKKMKKVMEKSGNFKIFLKRY